MVAVQSEPPGPAWSHIHASWEVLGRWWLFLAWVWVVLSVAVTPHLWPGPGGRREGAEVLMKAWGPQREFKAGS